MKADINNISRFVQMNKIPEVTSPFILGPDGLPDPSGIFSYQIFGNIGTEDRAKNRAYINLKRRFIHPVVYNAIYQMYRNLPLVVSGERWVKLVNGVITTAKVDDPKAETGIDFFINNWTSIKWNSGNDSKSREKKEELFETMNTDELFPDKWLVLPAKYRDINLHDRNTTGKIDMDECNSLYIRLLNVVNSESITFTSSYMTQTNAQLLLVEIHNLFTSRPSGKRGLIRANIMGKTTDNALISVISAPKFTSESFKDQQIPFNYVGVPLYQVCAMFLPFIVKELEDIFFDVSHSSSIVLGGEELEVSELTQTNLDGESLEKLVKEFIKDKTRESRHKRFSLSGDGEGRFKEFEERLGRPFTITDLLYRVASDVIQNKMVLATRFPITDAGSIIFGRIKILTTEKTIDLTDNSMTEDGFDREALRSYPLLPVGKDGEIDGDKIHWLDTVVPNNAVLAGLGADYDGDTVRLIGLFTSEAVNTAKRINNAKMNYIDATGSFTRGLARESGLAVYVFTKRKNK